MTSHIATNLTEFIDPFGGVLSPIDCWKLNIIATVAVLMMFVSVYTNSILLFVFYCHPDLRTTINVFVIVTTAVNLIGSFSEFFYIIVSNYSCRWMFGRIGCIASGFIMYTVGMMQIYLSASLSLERLSLLNTPFGIRAITFKKRWTQIGICFLASIFWSIMPLLGWSHYVLEKNLTSCSVEWNERSFNVTSYNVCLFFFGFIIPLAIILYSNLRIIYIFTREGEIDTSIYRDDKTRTQRMNEKRVAFNLIIYLSGFIISWTPYAVVSMISAFANPDLISPMGALLPAIFAKSSMLTSSIFYILSNHKIRYRFLRLATSEEYLENNPNRNHLELAQ